MPSQEDTVGQLPLLPPEQLPVRALLESHHYLGAAARGFAYRDEYGALVLAPPTSRRLPRTTWLELTRWCLYGQKDGGSRQWARVWRWLGEAHPQITTVVSYSDPSVGHTGALYRACNWLWAPTWHRLRPPPSGLGSWDGRTQEAVKDRSVWPLAPDPDREGLLVANDAAMRQRYPWAMYREPRFRRGVPVTGSGGGDYRRWKLERARDATGE
jgi:hypothetical protein